MLRPSGRNVAIVTTLARGGAEVLELGMSGWIADPPDADGLAHCVSWLLGDLGARTRAQTADTELLRTRFRLQHIIDETVQVYDSRRPAIGGRRRGDADSLDALLGAAASQ
jgi:hypothetical protein